mgnify:CR=1 FL=1
MESAFGWLTCIMFVVIALTQQLMVVMSSAVSLKTAMHLPVVCLVIVSIMLFVRLSKRKKNCAEPSGV